MSLNALATSTCSEEPVGVARACRSPRATRRAVPASPRSGRESEPATTQRQAEAQEQDGAAERQQRDDVAADLVVDGLDAWVTRTAPVARPSRRSAPR